MARNSRTGASARNKARNKAQEVKGQFKQAAGRTTNDQSLEARGRADRSKANLKQAGEKVKDAFRPNP